MSPQNATVLIFNDDTDYVETLAEILEQAGHKVVGTAGNIDGLNALLLMLPEAPDIALVDNQAPRHDGEKPVRTGVGKEAERIIQERFPGKTHIVALTTSLPDYGETHLDSSTSMGHVAEFITSLLQKER